MILIIPKLFLNNNNNAFLGASARFHMERASERAAYIKGLLLTVADHSFI